MLGQFDLFWGKMTLQSQFISYLQINSTGIREKYIKKKPPITIGKNYNEHLPNLWLGKDLPRKRSQRKILINVNYIKMEKILWKKPQEKNTLENSYN